MIPNYIGGDGASYNSVDASLWFIYALHKYLTYTDDLGFCEELWPVVAEIIVHYNEGVSLEEECLVTVDTDGLVKIIGEQSQVTWMDARIGGHAVTPRAGKPVEVNALWYNALRAAGLMARELGKDYSLYTKMAEGTMKGFGSFWNRRMGCLYDVLGVDGGDPSTRPNQLLSISLPFGVVDGKKAKKIVKRVKEELLTPGLRSLSHNDERYIGVYQGGQEKRDSSYHMGTVWSWLMGPYTTGFLKSEGYSRGSLREAKELLNPLVLEHVEDAGLGCVSEIFDGDPPHRPKGCISQAWGVAELLRCYVEDILGKRPAHEGKWRPG